MGSGQDHRLGMCRQVPQYWVYPLHPVIIPFAGFIYNLAPSGFSYVGCSSGQFLKLIYLLRLF